MLDDQARQFFQSWYQTELGERLKAQELDIIEAELDHAVGYYLVIQSPIKELALQNHRIRQSLLIAPELEFGAPENAVVACANELPLESDGVDLHVLHHTLDMSLTPHDDLREAARTLLPSGKLIIVGFNPWSLWGLRRLFSARKKAPWCGRFIAYKRLEDWLKVAGLTLEKREFIYYEPPVKSQVWWRRYGWLKGLLKPLKLPFSGVYVLTVTKQVKHHIAIKPRWRQARVRVPNLTKPTAKEMKN